LLVQRGDALEAVLEAASEQGGYVTALQAVSLGLTRDDIARLVGSGDLRRVRRGVFAMRHAGTRHEDDIAAWLSFERDRLPWERQGAIGAVVSHASAAALYRLGTIIPERPTVTLTSSDRSSSLSDVDVRHAPIGDEDWAWVDIDGLKIPATTPARTIVDLIVDRQEPSYLARAVTEALHRQLTTPDEIMEAARRRKTRSSALRFRAAELLAMPA
jgi:predicted transcriptional regulator of viral defense system